MSGQPAQLPAADDTTATPHSPPADPDSEELVRLRSEVASLRAQVDTRRRQTSAVDALRRVTAALLVMIAGFCLVASVVGLWAANTTLNTDRWVATVAPLPKNPQVAAAVSEYATTEVFQVLNVDQRLKEVLPPQAAFVVGPITGQVREYLQRTVNNVVRSDRFQQIWIQANRQAHQQALAILEGRSDVVSARGDQVSIDLLPLINQVIRQLSDQLPTLFGRDINLPDLSSGAIPANLRSIVESRLGVTLPANFAQFTVYDAGKLRAMQQALLTVKRDLAVLVVSTLVLIGLALAVSPRRRRSLLQLGLWLVIAAVTVTAGLRAVKTQLLMQVPTDYRDGVAATLTTVTATLRERGTQIIWLGVLLALVAYLVGPGQVPVLLRRGVATGTRATWRAAQRGGRLARAHGPDWIARYLDPLRIAGLVVAIAVALILSSWTGLLVVVIALVAYEVVITLVARAGNADPTGGPSGAPTAGNTPVIAGS